MKPGPSPARIWAAPLTILGLVLASPLLLLATPLAPLAALWGDLLLLGGWVLLVLVLLGRLTKSSSRPLGFLERGLRAWVARFAPTPEALWLQWARQAHDPSLGHWYLERASRTGHPEALFQEGLAWLEGGLGPGGVMLGVERLKRAAEAGHAEAAFRLAEALRTGHGCARDAADAERWYRRSAAAGCGCAAAWLGHAYACGDGVAPDPEEARRWTEAAVRLEPHPPLRHSPLRHDAAPEDPLVRLQGAAMGGLEAAADRFLALRLGPGLLLLATAFLAGAFLFTVGAFFWAGSSQLHHLPLLMLAIPLLVLAGQAWHLRREGPARGRGRLRKKAEGGDAEVCFRLALAHRQGGQGYLRDDLTAVLWFRRAAEAGHPGAMQALAEAYRGGHGVVRDPRAAAQWEEAARATRDQLSAPSVR